MRLHTLLGDYPVTRALKEGAVRSPGVEFDFADVKVPNTAFKRVVRDLEFDVAEYRDPPGTERAAGGKTPLAMLLAGEVDAAVLAEPLPKDERLKSVIPDPAAAAQDWQRRNRALQINHIPKRYAVDDLFDDVTRTLA